MKRTITLGLLLATSIGIVNLANAVEAANEKVGLNILSNTDWARQWPTINLMHSARPWITSAAASGPWNTDVLDQIPLDSNGYPLSLPVMVDGLSEPQIVKTVVGNTDYPRGIYQVYWDGQGQLDFTRPGVSLMNYSQGHATLNVTEDNNNILVRIVESQAGNHIRNIRVLPPGFTLADIDASPFHPTFMERLTNTGVLRFMDYGRTNDNPIQHWSDRPLPDDYTQATDRGASLEWMIDMANEKMVTPWFNVPHMADDHYIQQMAQLIRNRLNPALDFYLEYSNELWNNSFSQTHWQREIGCSDPQTFIAHHSGNDWGEAGCADGESAARYQIKRSMQIFDTFQQAFVGEEHRIRKVIAGWSTNNTQALRLLEAVQDPTLNPNGIQIDYFAIAPYFGNHIARAIVDNNEVDSITIDEVMMRLSQDLETRVADDINDIHQITENYGVQMIAYEAGQHLVVPPSHRTHQAFVDFLAQANRDPRMGDLYRRYHEIWRQSGGGLMSFFGYASAPYYSGYWGLLENQNQAAAEAPKYQAYQSILAVPASEYADYNPQNADADGDGVVDEKDLCPSSGTESPSKWLGKDKFMDLNGDGTFETLESWYAEPVVSNLTLKDTHGCNCTQLTKLLNWKVKPNSETGCLQSYIDTFINKYTNP